MRIQHVITAEAAIPDYVEVQPGHRARASVNWGWWDGTQTSTHVGVTWDGGTSDISATGPTHPERATRDHRPRDDPRSAVCRRHPARANNHLHVAIDDSHNVEASHGPGEHPTAHGRRRSGRARPNAQLHAQAAEAWARLGNRDQAILEQDAGRELLARLPFPANPQKSFRGRPNKYDLYRMDC